MWSPEIKSWLLDHRSEDVAISSNIGVYDKISFGYLAYERTDPIYTRRVRASVDQLIKSTRNQSIEWLYHLDFGCGPGLVATQHK